MKLPKLFGRKKESDEDEDDDDFEDEEFAVEAPQSKGSEDASSEDEPAEPEPSGSEPSEDGAAAPEPAADEEYYEDEEDYDDDDEDDDEEVFIAGMPRSRLLLLIGTSVVLVLAAIGGGAWWFLGGGASESEKSAPLAAEDETGVPRVVLDIAPRSEVKPRPGPTSSDSAIETLNAMARVSDGPGAGIVVPPVTKASFIGVPKPPSATPLPPVPDPALVEQSSQGPLPKIGPDGRKPWQVYARPVPAGDDRPRIVIIVSGLGLSRAATEAAITRLPGAVTLAFDPFAQGLDDWTTRARQAGHEFLLGLPMEPANFPVSDPGPRALVTTVKPAENLSRLQAILTRMTGYVGVITIMGSSFISAEEYLQPILETLNQRGLMYVDVSDTQKRPGPRMATAIGLPRVFKDLIVDETPSAAAIDASLERLEQLARKKAIAVGIADPFPVSLARIGTWAATLDAKEIALVPVSAVADKQFLE